MNKIFYLLFISVLFVHSASSSKTGSSESLKKVFIEFLDCANYGLSYIKVRECRRPLVDPSISDEALDRYLLLNAKHLKLERLEPCPKAKFEIVQSQFKVIRYALCFSSKFSMKDDSMVLFTKEAGYKIYEILL